MSLPEHVVGFHVGIVVDSLDDASAAFRRMLGGQDITWEFVKPAPAAIDPSYEASKVRVSYGRYGGMTIELIQVLEGHGHYARWLAEHGPGVQHLGFWVEDLTAATRSALCNGATLRSATLDAEALQSSGIGVVTVATDPASVTAALLPGSVHLGLPSTPVEVEFVGPAGVATLHDVLGDAYVEIVDSSPWER